MRTISFVNMKGGVAKTTLSINVADCLVRRHGYRVLLIDIDPQFNATQCLLSGPDYVKGCKEGMHTVLNVFEDSTSPVASSIKGLGCADATKIEEVRPWTIRDGYDILPGNLELYRLDMGGGAGRELRLKRYIQYLEDAGEYDIAIIDTPPTPSAWMAAALVASGYYVVPVKPEPLSATGIDLLRSVVSRVTTNHAHEIKCLGVVLTIAEVNTMVYRQTNEFLDNNNFWKGKTFASSLPKRTEIAREQGAQRLILDLADADAKRALASITKELVERAEVDDE